jgi:hypothetical protein
VRFGSSGPSLDAGDWKSAVARKQALDGTVTPVLHDAQQAYRFVAAASP